MLFGAYLKFRRALKGHTKAAEQYEELGGAQDLGFQLRAYQRCEADEQLPPPRLLINVWKSMRSVERPQVFLSFMASYLSGHPEAKPMLDWLETLLHVSVENTAVTETNWENEDKGGFVLYTNDHLRLLLSSDELLQFHVRLAVFQRVPYAECRLPESQLQQMEALELLRRDDRQQCFKPPSKWFRIPYHQGAPLETRRLVTDYNLKVGLLLYLSKEGPDDQVFTINVQQVTPDTGKQALRVIHNSVNTIRRFSLPKGVRESDLMLVYQVFGRLVPKGQT